MTHRERFLAVMRGEKPDRTAWFADLSYYYFSLEKDGRLQEQYRGDEGYLKFHTVKNVGVFFYPPFMWNVSYSGGIRYSEQEIGNKKVCRFDTPIGAIESIQKYLPTTYSWAYTSHYVNNFDQLKIMLYIHQHTVYEEDYSGFDAIDKLWGGQGIPTAIPPISVSPLQKLLARWAGVETTVDLFAQDMDGFGENSCRAAGKRE